MSWLSSNLTGGLSSISNFTGQLSSFTREMLTEGTDEVSDPTAELKVAQARINDLETLLLTQKSEYERIKHNNEELSVRLEASELQISNISKEYRTQLQNKEQELIKLRELSRFHDEPERTYGKRERHDSTDSFDDPMECKRLRSEITRLQTECQHWKSLANGIESQDQLHKEIDQYQHELIALQSSYSQKISNINKKHKQEMQKCQEEKEEYIQRIEELEELLQSEDINETRKITDNSEVQNDEEAKRLVALRKQLYVAEKLMADLKDLVKTQEDNNELLKTKLQDKEDALNKAESNLHDTQEKFRELTESTEEEISASNSSLSASKKRIEILQNKLEEQDQELKTYKTDCENLSKLQDDIEFLTQQNSELQEQLCYSQSEERRMYRSVEDVKSELEQLSCSTMELMEELQISQGLQKEQKIEIESLKNVRYVKGEAKAEVTKLRSALAALWERHLFLVQLYQQLTTQTVRDDLKEFQQRLAERGGVRLEQVVRDKEVMMGHSAELRAAVEELEGAVMDLQSDSEQVAQEAKDCVTEMGRQPDLDEEEGGDIVTALQAEKAVLESTIVGLEKKVQDLQELVVALQKQKGWREHNESLQDHPSRSGSAESVPSLADIAPQVSELSPDFARESDTVEFDIRRESEVSLEGSFHQEGDVLQSSHGDPDQCISVPELRQQLEDYQQQVEEFELVRRDWESEKEALEELVVGLRGRVKELQGEITKHTTENEKQLNALHNEKLQILSEKERLREAWKTMEADFVSLDISSRRVDEEFELYVERIDSLRSDLKDWVLSRSEHIPPPPEKEDSKDESGNRSGVAEETQTEESMDLLRIALEDFEKDNSLLRQQTETLIQEIEEKTSKMTDLVTELEMKSNKLEEIGNERRNLMTMINERDERIGELEESFNTRLMELTTSKDKEFNILQIEKEDLVKLLQETRQESALLKSKNNELVDLLGQNQQAKDELSEENLGLASVLAEKEDDIKSVRGESYNLVTLLREKNEHNASLVAENKSLLMEKEVLLSLVEEYKEKIITEQSEQATSANLTEEIKRLNETIQSREQGWKDVEKVNSTLRQEKERLEIELGKRNAEIDIMQFELKEKLSEVQMLVVDKDELSDVVRGQVSSVRDLEQKLAESAKEMEEIKDSLGKKDVQVDKLELDLREKGAENDLLRLDIAKITRELKDKQELIHAQVEKAPDLGPDDTQHRLAQLMRILVVKDQEIAALKQKDASLVELVSQTDRSSHQAHEEYEVKIQQARDERDRLLSDLSLRDEELLTLQDRLEAMREKMQGKDQASHLLHSEHARLLGLNESQANEMGKLRERNSLLQKRLEERERGKSVEAQRVHEENTQLKRHINSLKVEHETLTMLVHEKDKQISTLALLGSPTPPVSSPQSSDVDQQQLKRLMEEREVLLRERNSVHREKELKENHISQLQETVNALQQSIEQKNGIINKLTTENEELGKKLAELRSQLEVLLVDKSSLTKRDNRIIQLEEEISSLRGILENRDSELKQMIEHSRIEKSSMLVELENVRNERDDISEQKHTETRELKSKMLQLAYACSNSDHWQEANMNLEDIGRNFQTLIHNVKSQRNSILRERDNEIKSLREQLSNMTLLTKTSQAHDSGLEEVLHEKEELHRMLLQSRDEKEDLLREKESVVADLQEQLVSLSRIVSDKERASQQDLERVIHEKERIVKELDQARRDCDELNRAGSRWQAELSRLQSEVHELKSVLMNERDNVTRLEQEVEQSKMAVDEKERIVKELMVEREQLQRTGEHVQAKAQQLQEELVAATSGKREAETKKTQELERLRNHLVQVEESYTREALEAEEREKDLRRRIARAEEQLVSSSHSLLDRDRQASVQIESLNEQLQSIAAQRDRAVMELASAQEQAHQCQTSLNNLQLVLEQFQRERESQLKGTQEQAQKEVSRAWAEVKALRERENQLKSQLEMAARVTQQVVDLRAQFNLKQEELQKQHEEVSRLGEELRVSQERIKNLNSLSDSKIEKSLLKNMLMGYFNTPENKRAEVVRVIGGLLGFTHDELDKVGTGSSAPRASWISSLNPFGYAPPKTPTRTTASSRRLGNPDKSFSELFVSFLESESEVPSSGGAARANMTNPLLTGLTPQQSPVTHPTLPGSGRPIATSTPISTPARSNLPSLPPSSLSRPLIGAIPNPMDGLARPSPTVNASWNPLLVGSLAPVQDLPSLSSTNSLRTLLEGRT